VRGADLRVPVEVVEHLGHALLGEPGGVVADLQVAAGQQQALAVLAGGRGAGPDHAAADEPELSRVAAGLLGGGLHYGDALGDPGQVGAAGGHPAVGQADPLQGGPGHAAEDQRRAAGLDRLGLHRSARNR
jgi:hypothetical protein